MRRQVVVATILLLGMALPASAKMPPFEMEVEARGDTLHVTIRIIGDESLIHSFDSEHLNGLIAVFPAGEVDGDGRPLLASGRREDVSMNRVEPGTYQGSVNVEPGYWAVVPFPGVSEVVRGGAEGWYPNTVLVEVRQGTAAIWALAALGAAMAIAWRSSGIVPAVSARPGVMRSRNQGAPGTDRATPHTPS